MSLHARSIGALLVGLGLLCVAPGAARADQPASGQDQGTTPRQPTGTPPFPRSQGQKPSPGQEQHPVQPRVVLPPDALPDLAVMSLKATAKCLPSGLTVTLVAIVKNQGKTGAPIYALVEWNWWSTSGPAYLEKQKPTVLTHPGGFSGTPGPLKPGASGVYAVGWEGIPKFKKGAPGQYAFKVVVDWSKTVVEANENNNVAMTYVQACF